MKPIKCLFCLCVLLVSSCIHPPDSKICTDLLLQIRDESGRLNKNSTVELVAKGPKRLYDNYSKTPFISPAVKRNPQGYFEISEGVKECNQFWVIIRPFGNVQKQRIRHPIYVFTKNPTASMMGWSDWLVPDFEAEGDSHWMLLDSGEVSSKLPVKSVWPKIRFRVVNLDISNGFPGSIIPPKQEAQQGAASNGG